MRNILSLIVLMLAVAGSARGQEGQAPENQPVQPPEFGEEVTVTEVQLDVLVTDNDGNVIIGLGEDDFVVREDGKPVELTDVTFYSNRRFVEDPEMAARLGVDPSEVPVERYFVLFFHDQRALFPRLMAQQLDAARFIKRWVEEQLLRNDHVAVVSYLHKLKVHQDFTTDKAEIVKGVDDAIRGKETPGTWPSRQGAAGEGPSLLPYLPQGEALRARTTRIYDGLEVVARALGPVEGRKNLVLFSIGFGDINSFGLYTPDRRYYPGMVRALNDNNVAVYSVDLVPSSLFIHPVEQALNNALSDLSADTGGRYYFNFVNFLSPLEQLSEDNNGYYLLSYRSPHPRGRQGYQKVDVKTRNPEFDVRARRGYIFGEPPISAAARTAEAEGR